MKRGPRIADGIGVEFAAAVQDKFPRISVVLFSEQRKAAILLKSTSCGHSFDILAKPVHALKLID